MTRASLLTVAFSPVIWIMGCVTEPTPEVDGRIFKPPVDLDRALWSPGPYHGVELFFEVNPDTDVPNIEETARRGARDIRLLLWPVEMAARERYVPHAATTWKPMEPLTSGHEAIYQLGEWHIGDASYPSTPGAKLYVFKKRRGPFRFEFRGQQIEVLGPSGGEWVPSVFWLVEKERNAEGQTTRLRDVLRAGTATVMTDSARPLVWLVDGDEFEAGRGALLRIPGAFERDA